ncbi:site-2 protease family protein [Caldicoprobacter algeriensis]|uniref:site-2 protease family protein n=1 Tax=Caldicoprobacter algeriensis TaxID=699281 RepID=UPI00207AFF6B|nr:site-2 protease family protein [Caldicoprobacter algeriensis]MCM8900336.1 site-2 protease family protein [Caldicoprobacter algeriensis]
MKLGILFGINIYINKLLVILIAIAIVLGEGTRLAVVFLVVFIHELAHVVMARALNLRVSEIELLPFGGVARIESFFEVNPRDEVYIAIVGPMSNVILVLGCMVLEKMGLIPSEDYDFFIQANLMLAGFNLLPAFPLDGGRILRAILSRELGIKRATRITTIGGFVLALFLVMTGVYAIYYGIFNPTLFVMAGFLAYSAVKENRMATYVMVRDLTYKRDILIREGAIQSRELVVLYDLPLKDVIKKFVPHRYHSIVLVDEQLRPRGYLTEKDIVDGLMDHGFNVPVFRLLAQSSRKRG